MPKIRGNRFIAIIRRRNSIYKHFITNEKILNEVENEGFSIR